MTGPRTYSGAHQKVRRERGPASIYACACGCGALADSSAYQHTDPYEQRDERGRAYGSPEHYAPMTRDHHRAFDRERRAHARDEQPSLLSILAKSER